LLDAGRRGVTIETIWAWAAWLSGGIASEAPLIASAAAFWFTLSAGLWASGLLHRLGQGRLAIYLSTIVFAVSFVGFFFLTAALEQAVNDRPELALLIVRVGLWAEMHEFGAIAGMTALLFAIFTVIGGISAYAADWAGQKPTPIALEMRPRTFVERFVWVSAISPTAGFCEEFLFRGILLVSVLKISGDPVIAIALTSLAFGLGHAAYGLAWTIGSFAFGVAAGLSVVVGESLWPAIIAHTVYDMTVYFLFEDRVPDEYDAPAGAPARSWWRALPLG
jgi:membrane protease YdiL (CAAX protease family)